MRILSNLLNRNPASRWIKNYRNHWINNRFSHKCPTAVRLSDGWRAEDHPAICFSVAYNKPNCIKIMILACKDNFRNTQLVIVDNSSKPDAREEIEQMCMDAKIPYVGLPKNPEWNPNRSHALSMNWAYHNLALKWSPHVFGFLDHDCFPTAPFDLSATMAGINMWGARRFSPRLKNNWNLWAGFCFYRMSRIKPLKINFTHSIEFGLDTGGSNWPVLYSTAAFTEMKFSPEFRLPQKAPFMEFSNCIDGNFLHIGGASYRPKILTYESLTNALLELPKIKNDLQPLNYPIGDKE
jgi:hypothetical protein